MSNYWKLICHLAVAFFMLAPCGSIAQNPWLVAQDSYGLRVTPVTFNFSNSGKSQVQIFLKLQNITNEDGKIGSDIHVASAFFKGTDTVDADISSGGSNNYHRCSICRWVSGLPEGKDPNDWLRLRPGGSVPISYTFLAGHLSDQVEPPFNINATLRVFNPLRNKDRDQKFMFYFNDLK